MLPTRLLTDDLLLPELPVQNSHPMDSSRVLLGLMTLARKANLEAAQDGDAGPLEGVIAPGVLRSLLSALHFRDVTTVRHSRRVAQLATGMAQYLAWEGRQVKLLELAALLHDVGKIGVPDNILFKPTSLSPDEAELMSLHHAIGLDVLQACRVDKTVLEIVGQARDYYNGASTGFRRTGATMHMGARILAVADAYDALRTEQVYRKGRSHEETMKVLMDNAGVQFDGNVVCALSRWAQEYGVPPASTEHGGAYGVQGPVHPEETLEASLLCHIFSYLYLLESLYDGFFLVDSDLRFIVWNGGAERLLGHRTQALLGHAWSSRSLGYADPQGTVRTDHECPMHQVVALGRPVSSSLKVRHADGHWVDVETQTVPLLDAQGSLQGVVEIFRDLARTTRKPQEYRDLRMAASRDSLTSVANRGELETQLAVMLQNAAQSQWKEPLSVIFADVDFFKKINDTFGHGVGDSVLVEFARLLQHETYSGELVGRYGGEEFVILCPATDLPHASKRAERIRLSISRAKMKEMPDRGLTASFGVTQAEPGDNMESIFRRADKALYAAKHAGRNLVKSVTAAELVAFAQRSAQPEMVPQSRVYQAQFSAVIAADMVVYKLSGFVNDEKAKLIEVTSDRVLLRLGTRGLMPFWGGSDDRQPVEIEVNFGQSNGMETSSNRRTPVVLVTVRVRPQGWIRDNAIFESRARRVAKKLAAYFASEIHN